MLNTIIISGASISERILLSAVLERTFLSKSSARGLRTSTKVKGDMKTIETRTIKRIATSSFTFLLTTPLPMFSQIMSLGIGLLEIFQPFTLNFFLYSGVPPIRRFRILLFLWIILAKSFCLKMMKKMEF